MALFANESSGDGGGYPCIVPNCTAPYICFYDACLPLPPPPASVSDNVTYALASRAKSRRVRIITISSVSAASLFSLLLFLLLLFFFVRRRRLRRRQQQNQQHVDGVIQPQSDDDGTHHVWYIRTVGLDDAIIESIAATVYKATDRLVNDRDCTVCLGEFRDGDTIKLLPKCSHAFHLPCIDTWLKSHVNCPLCRAPVVVPVGPGPSSQIEIVVPDPDPDPDPGSSSSSSSSGASTDENEKQLQPIRRSVSMDSMFLGELMKGVELRRATVNESEGKHQCMRGRSASAVLPL